MPFVHLELFGARPSEPTLAALRQGLVDLMATTLHKVRTLTVVDIEVGAASHVGCGDAPLRGHEWTAMLKAHVTADTNSVEEKADFQRSAHALLVLHMGEPAAPLYIVVQEVPATDWGYGGITQAERARARGAVAA
jgi:4-oxalocrotonate tautomerase